MAATIGSALHWWAQTRGDQPAIVIGDEALTYRELHDWSSRLAGQLAGDGIKRGDRIGLAAPNTVQWPVAALGVLMSGAILVPLNPRFKAAEIRKTADDAELSAVIAAP